MEMWQKRSTLVFLTVAVAAMVIAGQDLVTLDDEQHTSVKVPFGSPLHLNCNLSTAGFERFRVTWYFNPSGHSFNKTQNISVKVFDRSANTSAVVKDDRRDTEGTVLKHTSSATAENSGWYFCEITVEIPNLEIIHSNGTEVVITKSVEHTTHPSLPMFTAKPATVSPADNVQLMDWWLWILSGVSAFILIVLLVICVLLRRRCSRSRAEDPIYENAHSVAKKQPSPRPGMQVENLKMGSSYQNLRTPNPGRRYDESKRRYK